MPSAASGGRMSVYAALRRCSPLAPTSIALVLRNLSSSLSARVVRCVDHEEAFSVGAEVAMLLPGDNLIQLEVAEVLPCGALRTLMVLDPRSVSVKPRKVAEDEEHSLVLCRATVNGREWPAVGMPVSATEGLTLGFSFARTWGDAPGRVKFYLMGAGGEFERVYEPDHMACSTEDLLHYDLMVEGGGDGVLSVFFVRGDASAIPRRLFATCPPLPITLIGSPDQTESTGLGRLSISAAPAEAAAASGQPVSFKAVLESECVGNVIRRFSVGLPRKWMLSCTSVHYPASN